MAAGRGSPNKSVVRDIGILLYFGPAFLHVNAIMLDNRPFTE